MNKKRIKLTDLAGLRKGEEVICPICKKGVLKSPYNYKISHYFECTNCKPKLNLD